MKPILLLLTSFLFSACFSNKEELVKGDVLVATDFESMYGWVSDARTVTKEHAHSGLYALKVDKDNEFSLTYDAKLAEVSAHKPKGIRVEAWVYLNSPNSSGQLTAVIRDPNQEKTVVNNIIDLGKQVTEYKKWVKVNKDFVFPASVDHSHYLRVYLWRAGATEPVYLDDLTVTVLE